MITYTPKQLKLMNFVHQFWIERGYAPTIKELADRLKVTNITVFEHVESLVIKGALSKGEKHAARTIQISDPHFRATPVKTWAICGFSTKEAAEEQALRIGISNLIVKEVDG